MSIHLTDSITQKNISWERQKKTKKREREERKKGIEKGEKR